MKALKFEIWGEFAHFRKPYTTSSPLTFPFPTRPALAGIISAIIGLPKNNDTCQNEQSYIGICLKNSVKKMRLGINLSLAPGVSAMKTGYYDVQKQSNRMPQIRYEYLKDPYYIVYFSHEDETIYNKLKEHLQNHTSVYTPYLGISEHIADFKFISELNLQEKQADSAVYIHSVINKKYVKPNSIELDYEDSEYFNVRMPNRLDKERIAQEYCEALFEKNCKAIKAEPVKYWSYENEPQSERNILFLRL
ncbi:MAG TPA: type I-B CRISPR-associated protein Cas5b [Candidatus Gastranaerophilales bacterium]|nr:type I-B CRISPR-associated protein Cas5b [Candidatus Gastranaerophilales bacterium]